MSAIYQSIPVSHRQASPCESCTNLRAFCNPQGISSTIYASNRFELKPVHRAVRFEHLKGVVPMSILENKRRRSTVYALPTNEETMLQSVHMSKPIRSTGWIYRAGSRSRRPFRIQTSVACTSRSGGVKTTSAASSEIQIITFTLVLPRIMTFVVPKLENARLSHAPSSASHYVDSVCDVISTAP